MPPKSASSRHHSFGFYPCAGHVYSAVERIDGEGSIKCPYCHAEAFQTSTEVTNAMYMYLHALELMK